MKSEKKTLGRKRKNDEIEDNNIEKKNIQKNEINNELNLNKNNNIYSQNENKNNDSVKNDTMNNNILISRKDNTNYNTSSTLFKSNKDTNYGKDLEANEN